MGIRRFILPLVVLAVSGVPATAPAAPDARTPPPGARLLESTSNAQVLVRGSEHPELELRRIALPRAIAAAKPGPRGFDLRALGDLARAAVQTYTGVELAKPAVAQSDQPAHVGFSGGDLDGDDLADVLDLLIGPDASVELVARGGTDGDELWSLQLEDNLIDVLVQPLRHTGTGRSDAVAVLELVASTDGESLCGLEACLAVGYTRFTWKLTVVDGATGAVRWTKSWDGAVGDALGTAFAAPVFTFAAGIAALNAFIAVQPSDDHDGDGVQDLVIDEVDVLEGLGVADVYAGGTGAFAAAGALVTATRATVVGGSDGTLLGARAAAGPGIAFLSPGVDGIGDPTRDLIWEAEIALTPAAACTYDAEDSACVAPSLYARALEMIDGSSMLTGWVVPLDTPGWIFNADGDIDGDGSEDLTYLRFGEEIATSVLSGADGHELWRADDVLLGLVGDDLVLAVTVAFEDADVVYTFNRRRGGDGALVSSTEHRVPIPTDSQFLFIMSEFSRIPDASGDGRHDAFAQTTIYGNSATVDVMIERGDSGAPIFERHSDGERFAIPIEDTNADARADLLDITPVYHRRSFDLRLAVQTLPSASESWSVTKRLFSDSFTIIDLSEDMDGDGGTEILVSSTQREDSGLIAVLYPLSGANGTALWEVGGPMSDPPPVPTGGIAGLVTGAGVPFQGACIIVTDAGGEEIAFQIASADGTYVIAELEDGSYLMRFGDCSFGTFVEEWYDDVATQEAATPVLVAGGVVTTGINADLAPVS